MNKKILILSGPTHEYLDPVRFIGNASSGLMGKALAEAATTEGFQVDFVSGPVPTEHLPALGPDGRLHRITSASDMLRTAQQLFPFADAAVFAAAVADYTPVKKQKEKMPRNGDDLTLRLRPTIDIAQALGRDKRSDQATIGFALQTHDGEAHARRKLQEKHLNGIVLNTPASLGAANGTFRFLASGKPSFETWGTIGKADCAARIIDYLTQLIRER